MCVGQLQKICAGCGRVCKGVYKFIFPTSRKPVEDISTSEEEKIVRKSKRRIIRDDKPKEKKTRVNSIVLDGSISSMSVASKEPMQTKYSPNKNDKRYQKIKKTPTRQNVRTTYHHRTEESSLEDGNQSLVSLPQLNPNGSNNVNEENNENTAGEYTKPPDKSVLKNKVPFKRNENYRSSSETPSSSNITLISVEDEISRIKPQINFKNKSDYSDLIDNYENTDDQKQVLEKMKKFLKKYEEKKKKHKKDIW